jgi:hypothetical protein
VPARIKLGAVDSDMIARAGAAYVRNCDRYGSGLRRLD